jgi:hypothetical protein
MERRTWTPSEKAKSIYLFKAHAKALRKAADFSYPNFFGDPSIEAEQELDAYLLNESKDDLRFNIEKDGTRDVDGIYERWNALHNDIKKYGTADPVQKQILIQRQIEFENKQRDVQSAEDHIHYLLNRQKEAEAFLRTFPQQMEAAEVRLNYAKQKLLNF